MKKSLAPLIAIAGLTLVACGSSDSADEASGAQAIAAQRTIDAARAAGFELDEACVNEITNQLSDDDAQAIVDAGPDGNPDVSAEGSDLATQLVNCLSQETLLDEFIAGMKNDGQAFDEACMRETLEQYDLAALAAQGANATPSNEMATAITECFEN